MIIDSPVKLFLQGGQLYIDDSFFLGLQGLLHIFLHSPQHIWLQNIMQFFELGRSFDIAKEQLKLLNIVEFIRL